MKLTPVFGGSNLDDDMLLYQNFNPAKSQEDKQLSERNGRSPNV